MLKKINVADLRRNMFIHELCGSWMEHPFWRASFLLKDHKDLQILRTCGITEVWIDTEKGLDVAAGQAKEEAEQEINLELDRADDGPVQAQVPLADEVRVAARIVARSKAAVSSMFQEARMGKALNADDAIPLVEEISSSVYRNPGAIVSLVRLKNKDEYTYMHSVAVCALMVALARQLGLNETDTREAGLAGLLHDVGKMMIPDAVLNKPGKLTDDEFTLIKSHPEEGHKLLLEGRNISHSTLDVCLHHHEKVDGSGYPHHLKSEEITLFAKMGAVCDVYDAITSNRPYKAGWDPAESLRKMAEWAKGHFDEPIFQTFVKSVGIYPIGSLVRLESGRLGVVVDQGENSLLTPKVRTFFSTRSGVYIKPELIDLSRPAARDKIVGREDAEKWGIKNVERMWMMPA
ncbi:phosphodiesterase [Denitratisoma sp. DHT3]|uniref:HD-GYP domain-containing protein n=1 Tax=Denitratisoma sp. DHT3 TaxID=1981880 RepID=UPI001198614C|nr:HD-GYP domain-containing protein [Denitratisoma sp. DHT3]QDX80793.1 phosphodiesterase [Denitratisoma sp. DHT3]